MRSGVTENQPSLSILIPLSNRENKRYLCAQYLAISGSCRGSVITLTSSVVSWFKKTLRWSFERIQALLWLSTASIWRSIILFPTSEFESDFPPESICESHNSGFKSVLPLRLTFESLFPLKSAFVLSLPLESGLESIWPLKSTQQPVSVSW